LCVLIVNSFHFIYLVFKTNTSYKRWDEGRKNWGAIVNSSRTILRQGAAWIHDTTVNKDLTDEDRQKLMVRLEKAVWCFCRSVTRHLLSAKEDEADYAADCRHKLRPELAESLIAARHRPTRALYELSCAIAELPIDERRQISMDASVSILCDSMGSSERIFTSPVPRFFTRHTARFLEIWLFLAPLGLYDAFGNTWNHWGTYVFFRGVRQQKCA
jgi:ion channel-forming bestrophin family protein